MMKSQKSTRRFLRGQLVEILSAGEILATLDAAGKFEGVPFMPEMIRYCGRRMRVFRRADKTCVEGYGIRQMRSTVFLKDARCDGAAHDGCQRDCLIFWKEAWLKPVPEHPSQELLDPQPREPDGQAAGQLRTRVGDRYYCQSTELAAATTPLSRWNVAHFFADIVKGELSIGRFLRIVSRMAVNKLRTLVGLQKIGVLAGSQKATFPGDLALQPGERVRVKLPDEIAPTMDVNGKNRGLTFEPDMMEFCGDQYEVAFPIKKIILEETGRMIELDNTVALKGVTCQGFCTKNCPRSNPLYWRESWLERVENGPRQNRDEAARETSKTTAEALPAAR